MTVHETDLRVWYRNRFKTFLAEEHMEYGQGFLSYDPDDCYMLVRKPGAADFTEYSIRVSIRQGMMTFTAVLPMAFSNRDVALAVINDLNAAYPIGLFQYDSKQDELTWNHFLAFPERYFPEKRTLGGVIRQADRMILLLRDRLLAAVCEEDGGKGKEASV